MTDYTLLKYKCVYLKSEKIPSFLNGVWYKYLKMYVPLNKKKSYFLERMRVLEQSGVNYVTSENVKRSHRASCGNSRPASCLIIRAVFSRNGELPSQYDRCQPKPQVTRQDAQHV